MMKFLTAEPCGIKVIEPIKLSTREEREQWIKRKILSLRYFQRASNYYKM